MKANLELSIDELILIGLPGYQRDMIAAAIESELLRLLTEDGLPTALSQGFILPEVQVDRLKLKPGAQPADLGARIAGSIYNSLTSSQASPGRPGRSDNE